MFNYLINNIISPIEQYSDAELIALWQQGTELAFEILYKRHAVKLLSVALKKINDYETAQEFVQDVFMSLFQLRDSLNPQISIQAYLYVALKNRILNYYRHQEVQRRYEQHIARQQLHSTDSTTAYLQGRELEMQIMAEVKKLPLMCRTVFLLSREEGLPNKKIATHLNISVNTVEQHMRKALRILRTSMNNYLHLFVIFCVINTLK